MQDAQRAAAGKLDRSTHEQAQEFRLPKPLAIHEALREDGEELINRPWRSLGWSGLAGGLSMGFSVIAAAAIHAALPRAGWSTLVVALGATVGYLIIILGRQGLITESAMLSALHVLSRPSRGNIARFAGVIATVSAANIAGALMIAALLSWTGILEPAQKTALSEMAARTASPPFETLFLRSLIGGWVIALAVWTAPAAGGGKVFSIFTLAYVTGVLHLTHLAAGSIEVLHLALLGEIAWAEYVVRFLPAVLLGNLSGAFLLAALLNHLQVKEDR
jgi:formate-nitrite transporter family protein